MPINIWNNAGRENANMHHATVLITLNLVHKQLIYYVCHMPQNLVLQSAAVTEDPQKQY